MLRLTEAADGRLLSDSGRARGFARGVIDFLAFAAAPTFGVMALLSGLSGGDDMICSSMHAGLSLNGLSLTGMESMYLLMGFFHLPPWLKLMSGRTLKPISQ